MMFQDKNSAWNHPTVFLFLYGTYSCGTTTDENETI